MFILFFFPIGVLAYRGEIFAPSRQPIRAGGQSEANELSIGSGATEEAWICG